MLYKNLPAHRLVPVLMTRLILDGFAAFKFLIDGGFKDFWAVVRAHMSFYRRFNDHRKKRGKINHRDVSCIYQGNIVIDHFIKGIKHFDQLSSQMFTRD